MVVRKYSMSKIGVKPVVYEIGVDGVVDIDIKGSVTVIRKDNETIRLNTASGVVTVANFDGQQLSNDQRAARGMKAANAIAQ